MPHILGVNRCAKVTKFCPVFDMGSLYFLEGKSKRVTSLQFSPVVTDDLNAQWINHWELPKNQGWGR